MTRRTLTTLVAAGILAFGGMAVGAAPASAVMCPERSNCTVGKSATFTTVGSVLRANKYGWAKGTKLEYRWYRNGSRIAGGWNDTYRSVRLTRAQRSMSASRAPRRAR